MSACINTRSWSTFCDVPLRDRFMPMVVTVRNASSTHKISAACLLSDAGMCRKRLNHEEHSRYWFCDFRNLGTGACGVFIGAKDHRMDFCLAHTIAEWSTLLKQNICIKCLYAFGINRHKCKADVSCLCQYIKGLIIHLIIHSTITSLLLLKLGVTFWHTNYMITSNIPLGCQERWSERMFGFNVSLSITLWRRHLAEWL